MKTPNEALSTPPSTPAVEFKPAGLTPPVTFAPFATTVFCATLPRASARVLLPSTIAVPVSKAVASVVPDRLTVVFVDAEASTVPAELLVWEFMTRAVESSDAVPAPPMVMLELVARLAEARASVTLPVTPSVLPDAAAPEPATVPSTVALEMVTVLAVLVEAMAPVLSWLFKTRLPPLAVVNAPEESAAAFVPAVPDTMLAPDVVREFCAWLPVALDALTLPDSITLLPLIPVGVVPPVTSTSTTTADPPVAVTAPLLSCSLNSSAAASTFDAFAPTDTAFTTELARAVAEETLPARDTVEFRTPPPELVAPVSDTSTATLDCDVVAVTTASLSWVDPST